MKRTLIIVLAFFLSTGGLSAQEKHQDKEKDSTMKHEESGGHHFALMELDEFHETLHPLVHHALPKGDFAAIRNDLGKLLDQSKAIQKAELPLELKPKKKAFRTESAKLVSQLKRLNKIQADDNAALEQQFDEMHEQFEKLAEMLRQPIR